MITEGNPPGNDWKNSYCIYCPNILKTYQRERETKLFEFSWNTNREELKVRKNVITFQGFVAIASLQWLRCNAFVAVVSASPVCFCLKTKLLLFLTTGYTSKISTLCQARLSQRKCNISCTNFSHWLPSNNTVKGLVQHIVHATLQCFKKCWGVLLSTGTSFSGDFKGTWTRSGPIVFLCWTRDL